MKVKNETKWNTKSLRRLFTTGLKHEGVPQNTIGTIYVVTGTAARSRQFDIAHPKDCWNGKPIDFTLWVPAPGSKELPRVGLLAGDALRKLAQLFIWGVMVIRNYGDCQNPNCIGVPWADGLIVLPAVAKAGRDLIAERAEHAQKMLAQHERRLKRQKKLVAKWAEKVRYYDKAIAERKETE